jgi:hypothetical protein
MKCIQKYWKVSDEGTRYLGVHFTGPEMILLNGGWTPYITQAKDKFDQYTLPTSPNIQMPTNWHVMPSDWDDYTLDIKLLKHYQSIIRVLIWTGTPKGHLIFYNSGPIIWKSNRQHTIALSTTEPELDNFVNFVTARSVLHTMWILDSMGSPPNSVNIFED